MRLFKQVKDWQVSLFFFIVAVGVTVFILRWKYNAVEIANVGVFFTKLLPFFLALFGIAYWPKEWLKPPKDILLIFLAFGVMFCFFIPKNFFYYWNPNHAGHYLNMQMFVPFIILSLLFAYKIGGGKKREVIVLGLVSILFMLSGIEDLAYIINAIALGNMKSIPDSWFWAHHINVFFGHIVNKKEALIFIGVHWVLMAAVVYFGYGYRKLAGAFKKELNHDQ